MWNLNRKLSIALYIYTPIIIIIIIILAFSPLAGLAGTRAQSGDRYGCGTLHF
jgi:hypothetical protein